MLLTILHLPKLLIPPPFEFKAYPSLCPVFIFMLYHVLLIVLFFVEVFIFHCGKTFPYVAFVLCKFTSIIQAQALVTTTVFQSLLYTPYLTHLDTVHVKSDMCYMP